MPVYVSNVFWIIVQLEYMHFRIICCPQSLELVSLPRQHIKE